MRVAQQHLAGLRQRDGLGATGALDELLPDDALEHLDLLADRRLGVAEPGGGATERRRLCDGLQGGEMPQFNAKPAIRLHDGRNGSRAWR